MLNTSFLLVPVFLTDVVWVCAYLICILAGDNTFSTCAPSPFWGAMSLEPVVLQLLLKVVTSSDYL